MAAAVAPEYCKPDVRVNPQVVPVGDHAPLFTCRIATQASTITLVHNAKDQPVGAVDLPCEKPPTPTRLHLIVIWIFLRVLTVQLRADLQERDHAAAVVRMWHPRR